MHLKDSLVFCTFHFKLKIIMSKGSKPRNNNSNNKHKTAATCCNLGQRSVCGQVSRFTTHLYLRCAGKAYVCVVSPGAVDSRTAHLCLRTAEPRPLFCFDPESEEGQGREHAACEVSFRDHPPPITFSTPSWLPTSGCKIASHQPSQV